ncbi:MAG: Spi family protease inhibitor [Bacteroidaceae bacterium]|nr:Spi family protease inhibitor [Bacteroidaceae bacterium]
MKHRKWILVLMSVLTSIGTWAQPITEQEAAERALQFLNHHMLSSRAKVMGKLNSSKMLKATKVEAESIYAFNVEGGGYVIASGDSRTLPVLGYSDSGSIDWTNMPENMRAWLKGYDEAIATLGSRTDFADGNLLTV